MVASHKSEDLEGTDDDTDDACESDRTVEREFCGVEIARVRTLDGGEEDVDNHDHTDRDGNDTSNERVSHYAFAPP